MTEKLFSDAEDPHCFLERNETPESLELFHLAVDFLERTHSGLVAAWRACDRYVLLDVDARETVWMINEAHRDADEQYKRVQACLMVLWRIRRWFAQQGKHLVDPGELARTKQTQKELYRVVKIYRQANPELCPKELLPRRFSSTASSNGQDSGLTRGMERMIVGSSMETECEDA